VILNGRVQGWGVTKTKTCGGLNKGESNLGGQRKLKKKRRKDEAMYKTALREGERRGEK